MRVIISQPQLGNTSLQIKRVDVTQNSDIGQIRFSPSVTVPGLGAISDKANTPSIYANGIIVVPNQGNINFNNTATINVHAVANGGQANVEFSVNTAAVNTGGGSYQTDVYANGTLSLANARLNLNNTATINIAVTSNATTANIAYSANTAAIAGPAFDQANAAYGQANAAYVQANAARSDINTTFATVNTEIVNLNAAVGTINTTLGTINTTFGTENSTFATLNTEIVNLNAAVGTINTTLGAINTTFGTLNTSSDTQNSTFGGPVNSAIAALNSAAATDNTTFSTINTTFATLNTEIVNLNAAVGTINTTLGTINTTFGTENSTFATLNTEIVNLNSAVGTINTTLGTINTTFATENTTFSTVNTSLSTMNGNFASANAAWANGNVKINAVSIKANAAYELANQAFVIAVPAAYALPNINSALSTHNTTFGTVNTSLGTMNGNFAGINSALAADNSAFATTNTTFGTVNTTFSTLNTSLGTMNGNFASINSALSSENSAFATTNTTFGTVNTTFSTLNTSLGTMNGNFSSINSALAAGNTNDALANSSIANASTKANEAYELANTALVFALPAAYAIPNINSALATHNTTFGTVNTSLGTMNGNFASINSALSADNSAFSTTNTTFGTVNSTFATENTTFGTINSTFSTINTAIAANGAAIYQSGGLALAMGNANINFNNTTSANLTVTTNGTTQVNVVATVNATLNLTTLNVTANIVSPTINASTANLTTITTANILSIKTDVGSNSQLRLGSNGVTFVNLSNAGIMSVNGAIGINVVTPLSPLDIFVAGPVEGSPDNNAANIIIGTQVLASRFVSNNTNSQVLEISDVAMNNTGSWQDKGWRLQGRVDVTWMGAIQFNGGTLNGANNPAGITFYTGTSTANAAAVPETMRIMSNGFVGIGNTTPTQKLSVSGNIGVGNVITIQNVSTGNLAVTQNIVTGNISVTTLANIGNANISSDGVYANGTVVIGGVANLNFNNTASVVWTVTPNGTYQSNVSAVISVAGDGNNYGADVLANGTVAVTNANLNFNNTSTVNVSVTANGTTQANIAFTVNNAALSVTSSKANVAYELANQALIFALPAAYALPNVNSALATTNTTFGTLNTNIGTAYSRANAFAIFANSGQILANVINLAFYNTATVNAVATSNSPNGANVSFSANAAGLGGVGFYLTELPINAKSGNNNYTAVTTNTNILKIYSGNAAAGGLGFYTNIAGGAATQTWQLGKLQSIPVGSNIGAPFYVGAYGDDGSFIGMAAQAERTSGPLGGLGKPYWSIFAPIKQTFTKATHPNEGIIGNQTSTGNTSDQQPWANNLPTNPAGVGGPLSVINGDANVTIYWANCANSTGMANISGSGNDTWIYLDGVTALGGITPTGWLQITSVVDINNVNVTWTSTATSTNTSGGGSVVNVRTSFVTTHEKLHSTATTGAGGFPVQSTRLFVANPEFYQLTSSATLPSYQQEWRQFYTPNEVSQTKKFSATGTEFDLINRGADEGYSADLYAASRPTIGFWMVPWGTVYNWVAGGGTANNWNTMYAVSSGQNGVRAYVGYSLQKNSLVGTAKDPSGHGGVGIELFGSYTTLPANPFSTTSGNANVTIAITSSGFVLPWQFAGNTVTIPDTFTIGGITFGGGATYPIVAINASNTAFTIKPAGAATGTVSGGGSNKVIYFETEVPFAPQQLWGKFKHGIHANSYSSFDSGYMLEPRVGQGIGWNDGTANANITTVQVGAAGSGNQNILINPAGTGTTNISGIVNVGTIVAPQVAVYSNGAAVVATANTNYINTLSVNTSILANGTGQANVGFVANMSQVSINTAPMTNPSWYAFYNGV